MKCGNYTYILNLIKIVLVCRADGIQAEPRQADVLSFSKNTSEADISAKNKSLIIFAHHLPLYTIVLTFKRLKAFSKLQHFKTNMCIALSEVSKKTILETFFNDSGNYAYGI